MCWTVVCGNSLRFVVWLIMFDVLVCMIHILVVLSGVFFQAEDGIRDLVRSRGLGDVYKRQSM